MNRLTGIILLAGTISAASQPAHGEVRLPSFFSDNMVVQQNSVLTVTGKAAPMSAVTFHADWDG